MNEELASKEKIVRKEEALLEKALDNLLENDELSDSERFRFMEQYAKFKDSMTKAREVDLTERKEDEMILGNKMRTKLGMFEAVIKTGLIALALWFELTKGTIFGGFMLKQTLGTLFKKSSITS